MRGPCQSPRNDVPVAIVILMAIAGGNALEIVPRGTNQTSRLFLWTDIVGWAADEKEPALRIRYAHGRLPDPPRSTRNSRRVVGPNPEHQMPPVGQCILGPAK